MPVDVQRVLYGNYFVCTFSVSQQNYLSKTDLDGSIFLGENPVFMSVQVVVISLGITTTWMDPDGYKDGRNMELSKSVLER